MDPGYIIFTMIMGNMKYILDKWYIFLPFLIVFYIIKNPVIIKNIEDFYEDYIQKQPKGTIVLESIPHKNKSSLRYQAIMWYLANNNNPSIHRTHEVFSIKFNYRTDEDESKQFFRIDQYNEFKITDNIFGKVQTIEKEEKIGDKSEKKENYKIIISSHTKTVPELIEFLDDLVKLYSKYQIEKNLSQQNIIEAIYNKKEDFFETMIYKFNTNVSFENRFFENKTKILQQIDFFLENPEYFENKGVPYHLGILLHGVPGCGKTSFIKALAKKTNRHIIDIKLNKDINLTELKDLFLDDKLSESLIIPIEKRLYVLEDIDAMGDIVHKRNSDENSEKFKNKKDKDKDDEDKDDKDIKKEILKIFGSSSDVPKKENVDDNNMSYLLNILDGLQENPGRIIIMTTNHIDKIDPAIVRPGRIDINLEFKPANKKIIEEILSHYWEEDVILDCDIKPIPHCKVVELCRSSTSLEETISKFN